MQNYRFVVPNPGDGSPYVSVSGVAHPVPLFSLRRNWQHELYDFDKDKYETVWIDGNFGVYEPHGCPFRRVIDGALVMLLRTGERLSSDVLDSGVLEAWDFERGEFASVAVVSSKVQVLSGAGGQMKAGNEKDAKEAAPEPDAMAGFATLERSIGGLSALLDAAMSLAARI